MINYKCKTCKSVLETDNSLGRTLESCPECGDMNRVPDSKLQKQQAKKIKTANKTMTESDKDKVCNGIIGVFILFVLIIGFYIFNNFLLLNLLPTTTFSLVVFKLIDVLFVK